MNSNAGFVFNGGMLEILNTKILYDGLPTLSTGKRHIVYGDNGSGKTSLCNSIIGICPSIYPGAVKMRGQVDGLPLFNYPDDQYRDKLLVCPQQANNYLLGFLPEEELLFEFNKLNRKKGDVDFAHNIYKLLEIDKLPSINSYQLSDGEKRRLALGLSILNKKSWIVLDEWNHHLDFYWSGVFNNLLNSMTSEYGVSSVELTSGVINKKEASSLLLKTNVQCEKNINQNNLSQKTNALNDIFSMINVFPRNSSVYMKTNGKVRNGKFRKNFGEMICKPGNLFVIYGKNGSGKSSLLKTIKPSAGRRSKEISYVLADPYLQIPHTNISETVKLITHGVPGEIDYILISKLIAQVVGYPILEDLLNMNFAAKKLFSIFLSTISDSSGIVIDEPFTGLDHDSTTLAAALITFACLDMNKAIFLALPNIDVAMFSLFKQLPHSTYETK